MSKRKATTAFHKALFLQAKSMPDFDEFVTQSRAFGWPAQFSSRPAIIAAAKQIMAQYSMDELRAARQHFNTVQLIAFWRYFSDLIERGIEAGAIDKSLPLFGVSYDRRAKRLAIQGISGEALFGGFFKESPKPGEDFVRLTLTQADAQGQGLCREELLISLRGRLAYTFFLAKTSMTAVYEQFLIKERAENSVAWEAYQTHLFLTAFLYKPQSPGFGMSIFDHIFFASNLRELGLFLFSFFERGRPLRVPEVKDFLRRQRRYNLRLSQEISLEDNHARNHSPEFMAYDADGGIVRMHGVPDSLMSSFRQLLRTTLGLQDLGCPFGRTKGIEKNALLEIYEYFDKLFLRALEGAWEFNKLFDTTAGCSLDLARGTNTR